MKKSYHQRLSLHLYAQKRNENQIMERIDVGDQNGMGRHSSQRFILWKPKNKTEEDDIRQDNCKNILEKTFEELLFKDNLEDLACILCGTCGALEICDGGLMNLHSIKQKLISGLI